MSNYIYYSRNTCRMCGEYSLKKGMSLTPTPPGNDFLKKHELEIDERKYPLDLYFCQTCFHIQLGHIVNPKILYQKNYTYVSATSAHFVNHLKICNLNAWRFEFRTWFINNWYWFKWWNNSEFFKEAGMQVLGVDPLHRHCPKANDAGIETIGSFFSFKLAREIKRSMVLKLITSHNACAHIDDLLDVIKGVAYCLDDDGVFVVEGYFLDVYENIWFDTITMNI